VPWFRTAIPLVESGYGWRVPSALGLIR